MIILCANQEWNSRLIESPALPIPFLDTIECGFPCQVEHEEDSDCVVADEGQHVDEFSLAAQVPDRKGYFGVAY